MLELVLIRECDGAKAPREIGKKGTRAANQSSDGPGRNWLKNY